MLIRVSTNFPNEPLLRQTPGGRGVWKECRFNLNDPATSDCDIWVVLEGLDRKERAFVRHGITIFFALEPPDSESYRPGFLDQFDLVIAAHADLTHRNVHNEYQGLPWHVGIDRGALGDQYARGRPRCTIDYDRFAMMPPPAKTGLVSVMVSAKQLLPGHRNRLRFVEALQRELGDSLHIFGRGIRPVTDKFDAIAPYRYHLVLENSTAPHYWSEKLADSFLGFAYPLYWGCPNIGDYFPEASLARIDIAEPAAGIAQVKCALEADLAGQHRAALLAARALVLDRYNTFDVIRRACASLPPRPPRQVTLRPGRHFIPLATKASYVRHRLTARIPYARRLKRALLSLRQRQAMTTAGDA
jgi:hypothetical protein